MKFSILTPEKTLLETQAKLIQAPGLDGWFAVMENHAPILAALKSGRIRYIDCLNREFFFEIEGGFFSMENNEARITIL